MAGSCCALRMSRSSRRPGTSMRMSMTRSFGVLGVVFQGIVLQSGSLRGDLFLVCMKTDVLPAPWAEVSLGSQSWSGKGGL